MVVASTGFSKSLVAAAAAVAPADVVVAAAAALGYMAAAEMIWKIWKKCEMIWKIWRNSKLNSEKIGKIWKKPVSVVASTRFSKSLVAAAAALDTGFFHIFPIFSLFNLLFLHTFHIISHFFHRLCA
jgi:hypothetical protein